MEIGDYVFIGTNSQIDCLESVKIGDHTQVAPRNFITDHNHGTNKNMRINEQKCLSSAVVVGSDVWLGVNVCVLPGVLIEKGAIAASNSVVREDVPQLTIVGGIPATPIGVRE